MAGGGGGGEQQGLVSETHEVQRCLRVQREFLYDFHTMWTGFGHATLFQHKHTAREERQNYNHGCHGFLYVDQASVLKSVMRTPMMLSMITISPKAARREPM